MTIFRHHCSSMALFCKLFHAAHLIISSKSNIHKNIYELRLTQRTGNAQEYIIIKKSEKNFYTFFFVKLEMSEKEIFITF